MARVFDKALAFFAQKTHFHVAIDIDGTLMNLETAVARVDHTPVDHDENHLVIKVKKVVLTFRLVHGALEFIKALSLVPGLAITFYSAGMRWRNDKLVKKLMRRIDTCWGSNMFSRTRFRVISTNGGPKDLRALGAHVDLERVIIVDDNITVPPDQARNLLRIPTPPDRMFHHTTYKNNLIVILGILLNAIDDVNVQRTGSLRISVACVLTAMAGNDAIGHRVLLRGLTAINQFAPLFDLMP
eukprot:m.249839 g.249839  ORF g.249839 m.249839 type:complete len:242 (+) comp16364_c0_seq1:164-889(+)